LAQILFQTFALADIQQRTAHAQGPLLRIALGDLALGQYPDPMPVLAPEPVLAFVAGHAIFQMRGEGFAHGRQVVGMNPPLPTGEFGGKVRHLNPQNIGPTFVVHHHAGAEITVPDAHVGAPERQTQPFLASFQPPVDGMPVQRHLDRRQQLRGGHRLDQVTIGIGVLGVLQHGVLGKRGQVDDGNIMVRVDALGDGDAIHRVRELNVHQHQIGHRRRHCGQRLRARRRGDQDGIAKSRQPIL
jgi:hypothetical protein